MPSLSVSTCISLPLGIQTVLIPGYQARGIFYVRRHGGDRILSLCCRFLSIELRRRQGHRRALQNGRCGFVEDVGDGILSEGWERRGLG